MSPASRPPLTSRIRASFDGKRSKSEVTSPTNPNGFFASDPQAIRNAIDEAINSETFQTAIAANLARLIKPSIKDALDTLQPVVEAVYSHEVLLRKMNRSVENILDRVDTHQTRENAPPSPTSPATSHPGTPTPTTPRPRRSSDYTNGQDIEQFKSSLEKNNKRTVATLAELSNAIEANNKKVAEVVDGIGDIHATLAPTKDGLNSLKTLSETSNTNTAVMQAQLDQLKVDIGTIIDAIGSDLGQNLKSINEQVGAHPSLLASHATKLDALSTDLVGLKGQADVSEKIQTISTELDALKTSIEGGFTKQEEHFGSLGTQVGSVITAVEGHTSSLSDLKDASANPTILEALQKGNESHASNAAILSELKERSLAPSSTSEPAAAATSVDPDSFAALQALKAELASLKDNIESGFSSHNETLTGLGGKVDNVLVVVEGSKSADQSADILAALERSNSSHASHTETLEGLKTLSATAPTSAPEYTTHFSALEAQIVALQSTLQSHTTALDEIKAAKPSSGTELVPTTEASSSSNIENEITAIIATLEVHTSLLNEFKDNLAAEILTSLHDIGQGQANHSTMLTEIREADVSDEILTALHTSNDSHGGHTAALEKLHSAVQASNDSHTAHAASLDEFKTPKAIESGEPMEAGKLEALDTQIGALVLMLAEHKAILAEIKDATAASNESHAAHTAAFGDIKSRAAESTPSPVGGNLEALESQITALSTVLEEHKTTLAGLQDTTIATHELQGSHTKALSEILDASTASTGFHASHAANLAEIRDVTSGLGESNASHTTAIGELKDAHAAHIAALSDLHASHTNTLGELKDGHAQHVAALGDLNSETKDSHAHLKEAIGPLVLGGAAGAGAGAGAIASHDEGSNSEILEEVRAVRTIVEKSSTSIEATEEKVTSIVSQIETNHTTIQAVAASIENLEGHIKDTGGQVGLLSEGVHLNERGLDQLKEHSSAFSPRRESIPEGTWFGSPKTKRQIVEAPQLSPGEKQYNYLSPVAEEQTPTREETSMAAAPEEREVVANESEPIKESVPIEATVEDAPNEEATTEESPIEENSVEETPAKEEAIENAPVEESPIEEAHVDEDPVEEALPIEETVPAEEPVSLEAPIEKATSVDEEEVPAVQDESKDIVPEGVEHSDPAFENAYPNEEASSAQGIQGESDVPGQGVAEASEVKEIAGELPVNPTATEPAEPEPVAEATEPNDKEIPEPMVDHHEALEEEDAPQAQEPAAEAKEIEPEDMPAPPETHVAESQEASPSASETKDEEPIEQTLQPAEESISGENVSSEPIAETKQFEPEKAPTDPETHAAEVPEDSSSAQEVKDEEPTEQVHEPVEEHTNFEPVVETREIESEDPPAVAEAHRDEVEEDSPSASEVKEEHPIAEQANEPTEQPVDETHKLTEEDVTQPEEPIKDEAEQSHTSVEENEIQPQESVETQVQQTHEPSEENGVQAQEPVSETKEVEAEEAAPNVHELETDMPVSEAKAEDDEPLSDAREIEAEIPHSETKEVEADEPASIPEPEDRPSTPNLAMPEPTQAETPSHAIQAENLDSTPASVIHEPQASEPHGEGIEAEPEQSPSGRIAEAEDPSVTSPTPAPHDLMTPIREVEPEWPSTPGGDSESASASTSAVTSPKPPSFPLSPGSKKGKKSKKEKKPKAKKEKVPFEMEGDDPE